MRAKVTVTEENRSRCRCAKCLTYADNELMGAVYCSNGNSVDAPQMQGCKCPLCLGLGRISPQKYVLLQNRGPSEQSRRQAAVGISPSCNNKAAVARRFDGHTVIVSAVSDRFFAHLVAHRQRLDDGRHRLSLSLSCTAKACLVNAISTVGKSDAASIGFSRKP